MNTLKSKLMLLAISLLPMIAQADLPRYHHDEGRYTYTHHFLKIDYLKAIDNVRPYMVIALVVIVVGIGGFILLPRKWRMRLLHSARSRIIVGFNWFCDRMALVVFAGCWFLLVLLSYLSFKLGSMGTALGVFVEILGFEREYRVPQVIYDNPPKPVKREEPWWYKHIHMQHPSLSGDDGQKYRSCDN